jgi:hypothetical protein
MTLAKAPEIVRIISPAYGARLDMIGNAGARGASGTGGVTRVTFEGRTVEYRSQDDLGRAIAALYGAENTAARRPGMTLAQFTRPA